MFISRDGDTVIDFSNSLFVFLDMNASSSGHVLTTQLPSGEYFVSVYDIEENGLINTGLVLPADTDTHSQAGTTGSMCHSICLVFILLHTYVGSNQPVRPSDIKDCNITITEQHLISAFCTHFPNSSSAEDGFMMVVQRNDININRARQLLVNETREGTASGPVTVEVEEIGIYHVAIFPKNKESGVVHSTLEFSTVVVIQTGLLSSFPTVVSFLSQLSHYQIQHQQLQLQQQ